MNVIAEQDLVYFHKMMELASNEVLDLEGLFVNNSYRPNRFIVNCSDLFTYATADGEILELDDLPLFEKCHRDLKAISPTGEYWEVYTSELFCCRKRELRPQRSFLGRLREEKMGNILVPLFESCGPDTYGNRD